MLTAYESASLTRLVLAEASSGSRQLAVGTWQSEELQLAGYNAGVRRALLRIECRDCKNWAGHYGAKLARPAFSFFVPAEDS